MEDEVIELLDDEEDSIEFVEPSRQAQSRSTSTDTASPKTINRTEDVRAASCQSEQNRLQDRLILGGVNWKISKKVVSCLLALYRADAMTVGRICNLACVSLQSV